MKKTEEEIKFEIKRLKELKLTIPHYTDIIIDKVNNWNLIEAQIQTLRYSLTKADIISQYPDDEHVQGAAEDAYYWMTGGKVLSPSESWAGIRK